MLAVAALGLIAGAPAFAQRGDAKQQEQPKRGEGTTQTATPQDKQKMPDQKPATPTAQQTPPAQGGADEALTRAEAAAASGKLDAATLTRLSEALRQEAGQGRGGARIQAAIEALQQQAKSGAISAEEVKALHTEVLDSRLDQAFATLMKKAEARGATAEQFDQVAQLLIQRAQASKGMDLDLSKYQPRLQQAVEQLKAKNAGAPITAQDLAPIQQQIHAGRLDAAMDWLEKQAVARKASRADYARARDLIQEQAAGDASAKELQAKLLEQLDQLEKRGLSGGAVTREEFVALRDQYIRRAREAASTKNP